MTRRRGAHPAVPGLLALVIVTLAVGRGGADRSRPVPRGAGAADVGAVRRELIRDGGALRLATGALPTQWNCWYLGASDAGTVAVLGTLLPTLFRSDEHGTVSADPDYLVGAGVVRVRPRQVVRYRLDPRAHWSDGRPIGYRDFRALWRALRGRDPGFPIASAAGYDRIANVTRGRDEYEVIVTFARPFGEWRSLFSPLYPAARIDTPADWSGAWRDRVPVTGGPFRLERIDRTAQTVSVVRDPRWWGPRPKLDRVVFRAMTRAAMPGALLNGEIDGFDAGGDATAYRRVAGAPGVSVRVATGADLVQLTFNGAAANLSDVTVRRAVAMALDRRVLARSALAGLGLAALPADGHVDGVAARGGPDPVPTDPERAARLLDQAGWRREGAVRRRDGRVLRLRYVYPAGATASEWTGELVQAMLGRIGVALTLRPVPDGDFFAGHLVPGDYDLAPVTWHGTAFPISAMQSVYARPVGGDVRQNLARIGSAALDALLDRAVGDLDRTAALRDAALADRMIWAEMPSLPLYRRPQIVLVRRALANWGAFGLADPAWTDIGFRR